MRVYVRLVRVVMTVSAAASCIARLGCTGPAASHRLFQPKSRAGLSSQVVPQTDLGVQVDLDVTIAVAKHADQNPYRVANRQGRTSRLRCAAIAAADADTMQLTYNRARTADVAHRVLLLALGATLVVVLPGAV
jgi:hypothetical protein